MIVIVGPTGVGKSALALELARKISGEIINADSMQIYKYMDIGTAKPTKEEFLAVPHHLFDILEPDEEFNVSLGDAMTITNNLEQRAKAEKNPEILTVRDFIRNELK